MSQILDARGNPFQGQLDNIGGETFTDARVAGATLGALNAELLMDLNGKAVARYDIRTAAAVLTLVAEATLDGTNYFGLPLFAEQQLLAAAITQESYVPSITYATTGSGIYVVGVSGFRRVRIRVSAYTSGNVTVVGRASIADQIIQTRMIPSNLHVTATAAANTAATATLPAAGAGMFHYITNINLTRNATAALAGTATIIHTSTNLPGTPAWSVGNAMAAGGTQIDLDYTPTTPLKSLVANTATTVVMAAGGAAVLNRVNVSYFVGF
jgi:hypothetical protein